MSEEQARMFERPSVKMRQVVISKIEPWDTGGARSDISKSVEIFGAISTPLLAEDEDGKLWVRDGSRRLEELVAAGIRKCYCYIMDASMGVAASHGAALSLHQRSSNPVHEARHIQELLKAGYDAESIAATFGVPLQTIRKRMKLLELPKQVIAGLEMGQLAVTTAERVANLTEVQQARAVAHLESHPKLTANDLKQITSASRNAEIQGLWEEPLEIDNTQVAKQLAVQFKATGLSLKEAKKLLEEAYA
jgi:ParB-like chromosome segregation protein Spo0J